MCLSTPAAFFVPAADVVFAVVAAVFAAVLDAVVVVVVIRSDHPIEKHADAYNGGGKPLPLLVRSTVSSKITVIRLIEQL